SAQSRKFTVKVGEMEVSMEEYNRQQSELIKDLQHQMITLQKALEEARQTNPDGAKPAIPDYSLQAPTVRRSVLWVGDHPKTNAVMIQNLMDSGVDVTTAGSSREGLARLRARSFDKVVTDLHHPNGVSGASVVGIELVKSIRQMRQDIPVYIFTNPSKAEEMFDAAEDAGANQITGSPTILMALLRS
ncbi:MAG TPA: response regulator, partial [Anaerolineales bacterium]